MEIKVLSLSYIHSNCYLISTEKAAIVIDPGFQNDEVTDFLKNSKNKERLILLTHAHFDHIGGAYDLSKSTDTKIAIGTYDNYALSDGNINLSNRFHAKFPPFSADILLNDGDKLTVGDITVKVIYTPGHTSGGVCYLIGDRLFSGDTLFYRSIGRTDFYGGDYDAIINSIKNLFKILPEDTVVYPGHGEKTTIAEEKENNIYIRG